MSRKLSSFISAVVATATLAGVAPAYAQEYDNTEATFTWSVGNGSSAVASVPEAVSGLSYSAGTALTAGTKNYSSVVSSVTADIATYKPAEDKKGVCEAGYEIDFSVKVKKGVSFTPETITLDIIKDGTDNAYIHWTYAKDGVEATPIKIDASTIRRNKNDATSAAVSPLHNLSIAETSACGVFTFRIYISGTGNTKMIALGNVKISGKLNGAVTPRSFNAFKIDFRQNPAKVLIPTDGTLPAGVTLTDAGAYHGDQHGTRNAKMTVEVDGPVRFTIGGCGYSNTSFVAKDAEGKVLVERSVKGPGCDTSTSFDKFITWTYNSEEATTLTLELPQYCPYIMAEACDLLPICAIKYYDQDGNFIGEDKIQGGDPLTFKYSVADITVAEGKAFRGWFNSNASTGIKMTESTIVEKDMNLYAVVTDIETVTNVSRYDYDLRKANFYDEDHEAITITGGKYNGAQHGWGLNEGNTIKVPVAGKAIITMGLCFYSSENVTVTDNNGNVVAEFSAKAATDGDEYSFRYNGGAGELTFTMGDTTYVHSLSVWHVVDFITYDEATGYYFIPANDVTSFLIALKEANSTGNCKIFLPNGTYDLGEVCLTTVSGSNISIIGESMEGTIIRNAPIKEGIGVTATILNTSNGLYLQDLTLKNDLDYLKSGSAGRAVCLQDKGKNTICKNVRLLSYQDTYYSNPQGADAVNFYWEDSEIHGVVDYLCGGGNVVYNRTKFVNEARDKVTIAAPYQNEASQWGYVMLDCSIENHATTNFNLGRAWGDKPRMAWIRTKFLGDASTKIIPTRFIEEGMNVPADKFYEYASVDENGNVVSPESNVLSFTKNDLTNTMETILTDAQAADYTVANIFGAWAPDAIAAQLESPEVSVSAGVATWAPVDGAAAYLVYVDGEIAAIVDGSVTGYEAAGATDVKVRVANARGGFAKVAPTGATAIDELEAVGAKEIVAVEYYALSGVRLAKPQRGACLLRTVYSDGSSESKLISVK